MRKPAPVRQSVDDYIAGFPVEVQHLLRAVRATVKRAVPKKAEETISYRIPAFRLNGMLVWFAAHKGHIGFYPGAGGISAFKKELARYKSAKGSVQFPFDRPLPLALIGRIVKFRVQQNLKKAKEH